MLNYTKPTPISLKHHPHYTEKWLCDRICEDTTILGLGDLEVKDIEVIHTGKGRLDLLLRDPDTQRRYEVEIMLGAVDPSHIIRTIEYWDIERKRYPQFDHCAVIIAETINARFLNVISLFNGSIPLIAIQFSALQIGDMIALHFTKVLDEVVRSDEEDTGPVEAVNREYWEKKSAPKVLSVLDGCISILKEIDSSLDAKYNKQYIGLARNGQADNFIVFHPRKSLIRVLPQLPDKENWLEKLKSSSTLDAWTGGSTYPRRLIIQVTPESLPQNREHLKRIFEASYGYARSDE